MGSRSKSRSSTASTQTTTDISTATSDNRVTDSGNIGGNITLGSSQGNVNIATTDFGAIEEGGKISLAAFDFASDAADLGTELSLQALASAEVFQENTLDLAGDSLDLTRDSIDLTRDTFGDALGFAGDTTGEAFDFGRDTFGEALDFAETSADASNQLTLEAIASADTAREGAFDFGLASLGTAGDAFQSAIDEIGDLNRFSLQQNAQNLDRAFAFATQSERSEDGQTTQDLLKFGAIIAAVVGAAFVFRGGIKL